MRDAAEIAREVVRLFWVDDANRPSWLPDRINDRLVARIAAAIEKDRAERWQPIETAPKDGTEILGYAPRLGQLVVSYDDGGDQQYPWCSLDGPCYRAEAFTYWQPLPTPPAASPPAAVYCAPCGKEHGFPPCQPV